MISTIKNDFSASIVVFLVALPLCLGIALASGAPLQAGIISGIIGGVVVGFLSQSQVSVSGPAAGLTAVVFAAIAQLGSFQDFFVAVVIAGIIQIFIGLAKGGIIAKYIPSNVIKGLLAAIGIILILRQFPEAVGFKVTLADDFAFEFMQKNGGNTFSDLFAMYSNFSWGAIIISAISIFLMLYWEKIVGKRLAFLPSALFVIVIGVALNAVFISLFPAIAISKDYMVSIPEFKGFDSMITFPAWGSIGNPHVWGVGLTIAVVASLESLLNLSAVEVLDPHKRQASPNREMLAQGVGNILCGLVGGVPITSVVLRGSVNVSAGGKSRLSTIFHGLLLLVSVLLLTPVFNMIPYASLASILLLTGYKLTKLSLFKEMYHKGFSQFLPFLATILAILFTDLLIGVLIGLAISSFFVLKSNFKNPFILRKERAHIDETIKLELPSQVSFLNKASIKDTLWNIPSGSKVIIDATYSNYIDPDVLEIISDYKNTVSKEKEVKLNIVGLKESYQLDDYIQFVNVLDKASQEKLAPSDVLDILKKGNSRFAEGVLTDKYLQHQVQITALGQNPFAVILSCMDSRTPVEYIFDLGMGDVCSIRIAGNILNSDVLESMELAVNELGVKLIVVLGHTRCGAITTACKHFDPEKMPLLLKRIIPAIEKETDSYEAGGDLSDEFIKRVAKNNVLITMARIKNENPHIAELEKAGKILIVGGLYDVNTGKVAFYE